MADDKRTLPGTRIRDLTGETFGRWTVLGYRRVVQHQARLRNGRRYDRLRHFWDCRCICGVERAVLYNNLVQGYSQSCGCVQKEQMRQLNFQHGVFGTRAHSSWIAMLNRCYNPKAAGYQYYGGRGIDVCPQWRESVHCFIRDVGEPPDPKLSLDRIDNNRGYWPDNVRWATSSQQMNNARSTAYLPFAGKVQSKKQWAQEYGLNYGTFLGRLRGGWPLKQALETPPGVKHRWNDFPAEGDS